MTFCTAATIIIIIKKIYFKGFQRFFLPTLNEGEVDLSWLNKHFRDECNSFEKKKVKLVLEG